MPPMMRKDTRILINRRCVRSTGYDSKVRSEPSSKERAVVKAIMSGMMNMITTHNCSRLFARVIVDIEFVNELK
jgi:hypothetical protein